MQIAATPILAGVELVELARGTDLHPAQIRGHLVAIKSVSSAGLAISWDLLHIPLEWLELVEQVYFKKT
jgi:hypothetical protein